jgi:gliding motility-associated-like protein
MKRLLFLFAFLHSFFIQGQCDLAITDVNLNTYEVTVEVLNSEGCGSTGYNGSNEWINMLMIGFHVPGLNEAVDVDGPDLPCFMSETSNHPGWWFGNSASSFPGNFANDEFPLETGDVFVMPLDNPIDADCSSSPSLGCCAADVIDYWLDQGECLEFVIWQINYSNAWYQFPGPNAPGGGWAEVGALGNGQQPASNVQIYPDMDCDNSWSVCRDDNPGPPMIQGDDVDCDGATVVIPGCTDPDALNYDPNATVDDGSCVYPPDGSTDAVITNISFNTGCDEVLGPWYQVQFTVTNNGDIDINSYCVDMWVPDAQWCYDAEVNGVFQIPPGEGQYFTTGYFYTEWNEGQLFTINVNTVNDEIVTGNNNTTVLMPPMPTCDPVEGCTDPCAMNYDPSAEIDDGSCEYETLVDTVYIEIPVIDTVFIQVPVIDTVYIDVPVIDTVYVTETEYIYVTDTVYVPEYITVTDTVVITISDTVYIDCVTGQPCDENPGMNECADWTSIYIPNTFTPNNDGFNDVWKMIYDLNCWYDVEFRIFNRWGTEVYHGYGDDYDSYPFWNGSVNDGGAYVPDGVYTYTFRANKLGSTEVYQAVGHVTIFR